MHHPHQIGPIEPAINLLGDKWTPLLLRELAEQGSLRFSDLCVIFPHLSERTLTQRLKLLYDEEIIDKLPYSTHPLRYRYRLSRDGQALVGVVRAMAEWSAQYRPAVQRPTHRPLPH